MALPSAVEAQEARANALYEQAYGPKDASQAPQGTPAAEPTQVAAPVVAPVATEETWEARFKALNGKYNAEVPRLAHDKRELQAQVTSLSAKLTSTEARLTDLEAKQAAQPLVTPQEVQEFGEPLVDLIRRVGREEVARAAPAPSATIEELRGDIDSLRADTAKTAEQTFFTRLTELAPDWIAINDDPAFHSWLAQADDLSGDERQTLLVRHQANLDPVRVARFFTNFKASSDTRAATAQTALEQQVVPDSSRQALAPRGKAVFTRRDVAAFYADWRGGRISEADAIAKEAELQLALNEGRVR